jgi:hypothetical protein
MNRSNTALLITAYAADAGKEKKSQLEIEDLASQDQDVNQG